MLSNLQVEPGIDEGFQVTVTETNTGSVDGEEVIQSYLARPESIPTKVQAVPQVLTDFKRIAIAAGQSKTVELGISWQSRCLVSRYPPYIDDYCLMLSKADIRKAIKK